MDILKKNKKIKRADKILPEVYGTTLNNSFECSVKLIKEGGYGV